MSNVTPPPPTPTQPYKAVLAFVLAFAGAVFYQVQGRSDLGDLKTVDWILILLGAVVIAGGVYVVPNPAKR